MLYSAGSLSIDGDSLIEPEFSNSAGSTSRFFPYGGGPINFSTSSYDNVSFFNRPSASCAQHKYFVNSIIKVLMYM